VDSVAADDTQFGARIAPGPLVYAISIGLAFQIGRLTDAVIAFLGTAECRRLADCYIDDTVSVQCEVIDARPSTGARRSSRSATPPPVTTTDARCGPT
jgi:acyl dehydratase